MTIRLYCANSQYIHGVKGDEVEEAARPISSTNLSLGVIGCWRGHANAWKVDSPIYYH